MKKIFIYCIICLMGIFSNFSFGQIQFESSPKYGQVLDVVYSPTTPDLVFARSVTNHILRSDDNGQNWKMIHSVPQENWFIKIKDLRITEDGNFLTYLVVAESTFYNRVEIFNVQTGEVHHQMYSPVGEVEGSLAQTYSIAKNDLNKVLLHTTKIDMSGLVTEAFFTQDGGENWNLVYSSTNYEGVHLNNVAISPHNSNKFFLMRGFSYGTAQGGLYVSEDAGQNWEEQIYGWNLSAIAFHPTNPNTMFLGSFLLGENEPQRLLRTTNNGMSWVELPINWTDMSSNVINAIVYNPNDHSNIVVLEENEVLITHDSGDSWENYVYNEGDYEQYFYGITASFNPFEEDELIISANYLPFISQDGGVTLEKFETPFAFATSRMSLFNGENQHVYYGISGGFIHKDLTTNVESENGLLPVGYFSDGPFSGVYPDPNSEGRIFTSFYSMFTGASLYVSNEHGANRVLIYHDYEFFLTGIESLPSNPNHVLAASGETLYKFNLTNLDSVTNQIINLPVFGRISSMLFGQNENEFFITIQNKIYHTSNSGQNWTELTNGLDSLTPDVFTYDLVRNPLNVNNFALATSIGIFTSEDAGQSWTHTYQGNPVHVVKFSPFVNGVIAGSSRYDDGSAYPAALSEIIYSIDGGTTWENIYSELGYIRTINSDIMFNENQTFDAYFQVEDLGLVRLNVDVTTETMNVIDLQKKSFTIYPNPTSNELNIASEKQIREIVIFNSVGQKIMQTKENKINVSHLNSGVYFVSIIDENNYLHTQKFLKN